MPTLRHITEFFSRYGVAYDSKISIMKQFQSLSEANGWNPDESDDEQQRRTKERRRRTARGQLNNATAQDFNLRYGVDVGDIGAWKGLCEVIGIQPIPEGLEECREVMIIFRMSVEERLTTLAGGGQQLCEHFRSRGTALCSVFPFIGRT